MPVKKITTPPSNVSSKKNTTLYRTSNSILEEYS